jgi:hypothetical protein
LPKEILRKEALNAHFMRESMQMCRVKILKSSSRGYILGVKEMQTHISYPIMLDSLLNHFVMLNIEDEINATGAASALKLAIDGRLKLAPDANRERACLASVADAEPITQCAKNLSAKRALT